MEFIERPLTMKLQIIEIKKPTLLTPRQTPRNRTNIVQVMSIFESPLCPQTSILTVANMALLRRWGDDTKS